VCVPTTLQTINDASDCLLSAEQIYHSPSKRKRLQSQTDTDESDAAASHAEYLERRRKNNAASKRSRETRKLQMVNMEEEVVQLEQKNARLRQRVAELEKLTKFMKSAVVDAIRQTP